MHKLGSRKQCNASGWTSSSTMTGPWCTTSCVPMRRASATKWRPSIPPTCYNPLTFLHKSGLTSPWQIPLFSVGTIKSQIKVTFLPYKRIPIKFQHLQVRLKQSLQRKASTKKDSVRLRTMQPWEVFFTWCQYMLFITISVCYGRVQMLEVVQNIYYRTVSGDRFKKENTKNEGWRVIPALLGALLYCCLTSQARSEQWNSLYPV